PLDVADDPDLRHPGGNGQAGGLARIPECVAVVLSALPWHGDVDAGRRDAEIGRASQQRTPEGQQSAVEDTDACGAPRGSIELEHVAIGGAGDGDVGEIAQCTSATADPEEIAAI